MTRHQKNATASTVYTYYERKKDQKASGYGTLEERLPKEVVNNFYCCCLTLLPCVEPVVTPHGYLYEKEAILEYILRCKQENARKLKEYEEQQLRKQAEEKERDDAERERRKKRFISAESTPAHSSYVDDNEAGTSVGSPSSDAASRKRKHASSFWIPSQEEENTAQMIEKPKVKVCCPMSGRPLKFSDLIPVKFTTTEINGDGNVVAMDSVENVIKKDWIDPTNGKRMTENDIIALQRGGTGFAAVNTKLNAKLTRPVLELQ